MPSNGWRHQTSSAAVVVAVPERAGAEDAIAGHVAAVAGGGAVFAG